MYRVHDSFCEIARFPSFLQSPMQQIDVDKYQHRAFDPVFTGPVRMNRKQPPRTLCILHFTCSVASVSMTLADQVVKLRHGQTILNIRK